MNFFQTRTFFFPGELFMVFIYVKLSYCHQVFSAFLDLESSAQYINFNILINLKLEDIDKSPK